MTIQLPISVLTPDTAQTGQTINLTATGQITSLEGDTAIIHLTATNGTPLSQPDSADLDEPALLKLAHEEDGESED